MHSSGSPTRDPPVLTPTLVLSVKACWQSPWCDGHSDRLGCDLCIGAELYGRCRHLCRRLDWSPRLVRGPCSTSDHQDQTDTFIIISSNLNRDHGKVIHGAWGLIVNIALVRSHSFFYTTDFFSLPPSPWKSICRTLWWNCAELSIQQPCKISSSFDGGISGDL